MQTFKQKKIVLAVGTALMVMAGAAQAAAPALRATAPAVVTATQGGTSADTRALLSATGLSAQTVTFSVALNSAVTTAGITGDIQATAGNALGATTTGLITNAVTTAGNNVNVYTGTLSGATALPVTSATLVPDATPNLVTGTASITVVLTAPIAPAAYRVNAGNLEYTADNSVAAPTWAAVNVDVQSAVAGGVTAGDVYIYTESGGAAGYTAGTDTVSTLLTVTGTVKNALAPTPTIATRSTAGAALIDGVVVDTGTPVTVAALPAVTNLKVVTTANAPVVAATDITAKMASTATGNTQVLTFTTPATTIGWVSGLTTATAADNAAYASTAFNTGVNGATAPVSVDGTATAAAYTQVVNALDGSAAKLDDSAGTSKAVTTAALAAAVSNQLGVAAVVTDINTIAAAAVAGDTVKSAVLAIGAYVAGTPAALNAGNLAAANAARVAIQTASAALTADASAAAAANLALVQGYGVTQSAAQDALVVTATAADAAFAASFAAPAGNIITDGAAPVLVSAATNATAKTLSLTFSEPMTLQATGSAADMLREIAENVVVAGDSLAALNLNNGGTLSIPGAGAIAPTAGQSTLVINDATTALATYAAGKAITVNTGIHFAETNDAGYSLTANVVDPLGGLDSTSGVNEGASGTQTSAAAVLDAMFDATNSVATTARASTGADATKVATIQVKFPAAGAVAFAAGKTVTNLAGQIVVHVNGTGVGNAPVMWDFYPSATQMTLTNSTTLDITIPTPLLYSNVPALISMNLEYLNNPGGGITGPNVLVAAASATDVIDASTGGVNVTIPFAATIPTNNLLTQSIVGSLTSATAVNGDLVEAYVARWTEAPAVTASSAQPLAGAVTAAAITINGVTAALPNGGSGAAIQALVDAERAAVTARVAPIGGVNAFAAPVNAALIPLWVVTTDVPQVGETETIGMTAYNAAITAINNLASSAAFEGAHALTGADASLNGGAGNYLASNATATQAAAAQQAGVAAALSVIANGAANIPAASMNAVRIAASAGNATVGSVVNALYASAALVQLKQANLNPITGAILGVGPRSSVTFNEASASTAARGLEFIKAADGTAHATAAGAGTWASGVVGTVNGAANSYNLLLGIEPTTKDLATKANPGWFVLLVHVPASAVTAADLDMLTSADPVATNFMPYAPDLFGNGTTRTTLTTNLADILKVAPAQSTNWALNSLGNPSRNARPAPGQVASFTRGFVGLDVTGAPSSFWTSDGAGSDMAMAMSSNRVYVATELATNDDTLSTIVPNSYVSRAEALAWKNDVAAAATEHIDVLQVATAPAAGSVRVGPGWSLVSVPAAMTTPAGLAKVDAVIKVGAQVSSGYTWIKATDAGVVSAAGVPTTAPALTAGEAVFVYSRLGGPIN